MPMTPFELLIELKTPMVMGKNPIRLDGLLWHCLLLEHGCPEKAKQAIPDYLNSTGRFYHASSAAFAVEKHQTISHDDSAEKPIKELLAVERSTIGSMSRNDLHESYFSPNSHNKKKYGKVTTEGGPYINRLRVHKAYWSDGLLFHGVGNGEAIASLLEHYLTSVGLNASIGFGTIGRVCAKAIERDLSLVGADNKVARPIPIDKPIGIDFTPGRVAKAILTPPFRFENPVQCYMPESTRIIYIQNHLA